MREIEKKKLKVLYKNLKEASRYFLGYPCNLAYDYPELDEFFALSINNVGDPFGDSLYRVNTHEFEREVLCFFADLYRVDREKFWGYVTNGGTESNMYGLYLAREANPGGIVYFSEDTHYSISKTVKVLNMPNIMIRSQKNGEIDYDDLGKMLTIKRESPAIIVANIGTTMKGAVDKVEKILDILKKNRVQKYYIHCDAALGGMILPFVKNASLFDFRLPIGSIAVSGHKMIGSPMPCGVVIARKKHAERIKRAIEYVGILDTTLSGSRNGHSVLILWLAIKKLGLKGFEQRVGHCLAMTDYALKKLKEINWPAWANENYNTVVLKRPDDQIVNKWQLAVQGDLAHILVMPHADKKRINGLIHELQASKK
ncbi:MAG: Pyridoxal-dependent decarboxylase [Candidatus Azambacteria bacterium GW2011_GWB2_46_37]|uniref:Pyridoxal-dependent decarboxylase n=3 Tax=Candidatus Azamiibacteriota TaxID=1752741 RepID=A0A0G1NP53_9BACT|nr:MAG: Pyridoxal-dependent decarboxylase [Candidatus Azambacteria bacterium GW2011_GWC1_46_13]KKU38452.1 MAG: Pyridoxal-dependent decarboxylase [Candidatus Azambacteria bacterium GW2011_GWF2_46_32]KKU39503.1 MAG: Pyridoxal-dependent decarboxylase [Candidatus Azambacteria bacterium GW2011_GWB2_46_37]HAM95595.1 histidine decarboxylase [Candidatus Azambacteria bacterium]HAQ05682.1 histidine decarboxylase [Candidatus Azambacteria bacterium]